jgi:glycosyltransferase involved in cell wall biosynthesis
MSRIVHLIPGLTGGGAERQLTLLAPAQAALGHEVHIGVIRGDIPASLIDVPGVHVQVLSLRSHYDPLLVPRIVALVRAARADIVQTWLMLMDVAGATAAALSRTPWILSERSEAAAYPATLKNRARAKFGTRASAIVANSAGGVRYWAHQGVPPARIHEVPNAIDFAAVQNAPAPTLPAVCAHRPFVLFVGRLSEEKRPFVLIDALAEALPSTNAVALLCGVGPLADAMQLSIAAHGIADRVLMAGHRLDVFGLLRSAKVCVAISRFEGSPNVVLEAMAAGCPLVVSDIPSYRALLDESSAWFVPVDDSRATARAIEDVLARPEAAAIRAASAAERVQSLTPATIAASLDVVYHRVLGTLQ